MDADRWEREAKRFERKMQRLGRRWEHRQRRWGSPGKHLFSGVVFVTVGAVFLLGNLGILDVDSVLRFWPVILIAVGVFKIIEYGDDYAQGSGIFWVVVGGLFLLGSLRILPVSFRDLWPVLLIAFGALLLWRSSLRRRDRRAFTDNELRRESPSQEDRTDGAEERRSAATSSNSILSATAIMGGVERRNNSQDFRGGHATAILGGCEIDLRAASITMPHEAIFEVFAMWGGIEVRVPPDWTVVSQVDPIMGGYEDKTQPPKEESKRLLIRGTVIMGGIEVKN
jgi:predicted membrane protein